ncbi:MarR family transcriptional regulator [Candidatus Bathyarchaeota archaeon]|nr:MarR family transcriptional regulator [Candidatus Bathyarchaeota archaeon]
MYAILFSVTSFTLLFSLRRIREETTKHREAKILLDDVIYSFSKDLKRQEELIQELIKNYEGKSVENVRRIEEINAMMSNLKSMLEDLFNWRERFFNNYEVLKRKVDEISVRYEEILRRINEIEKLNEQKSRKIEELPEIEPSSAFTVGENETLMSLTETELKVLELLAVEGEKTVPEIKDRIKLTREHTARLMKNLYARGYVERRTDRIPYVYSLNKNVENFLKKREKV